MFMVWIFWTSKMIHVYMHTCMRTAAAEKQIVHELWRPTAWPEPESDFFVHFCIEPEQAYSIISRLRRISFCNGRWCQLHSSPFKSSRLFPDGLRRESSLASPLSKLFLCWKCQGTKHKYTAPQIRLYSTPFFQENIMSLFKFNLCFMRQ